MIKSLLGIGSTIATGGLNAFYTDMLNERNAERQNYYWNEQANKSFALGEKSADNAMKRQIQLYNQLQSPEAIKQQLLNAGLNPAMMYSQGGMGGQVSSGPQGQNGISPMGISSLGLQNVLDPLTASQIKNIEADTENKKADTENLQQKTKTEILNQTILEFEKIIKSNDATISTQTLNDKITQIQTQTQAAIQDLTQKMYQNEITKETYQDEIQRIKQETINAITQGEIMKWEIEKIKAETDRLKGDTEKLKAETEKIKAEGLYIRKSLGLLYNEMNLRYYQSLTEKEQIEYIKELKNKVAKEIELEQEEFNKKYSGFNKQDAFRVADMVIDGVGTAFGISTGSAMVGAMGKKMGKVGF